MFSAPVQDRTLFAQRRQTRSRRAAFIVLAVTLAACGPANTPKSGTSAVPTPSGTSSGVLGRDWRSTGPGNPIRAQAYSGTVYLSDLQPLNTAEHPTENGWGPYQRDTSNGEKGPAGGNNITSPMRLNGKTYTKGLGVHATSNLVYDLSGTTCTTFSAEVGLDDEVGAQGSVQFQVIVDGKVQFTSGVLTGQSAAVPVSVNVTGAQTLKLTVTNGNDGFDYDHADWAEAKLSCGEAPTTGTSLRSGPTNLCLGVANGSTEVRTPVQIQTCGSNPGQQWKLTAASELRTFGGSRCLDVRGGSTQPQTIVQSYSCHGGTNQQWSLKPNGTIVSVQSGLCLTVLGGGTAPGTGIDTWPCSSDIAHQKWSLQGVSTDTQAPTPPSGLKTSGLSCNAVTLSWAASSDNVGIAFYDIYSNGQALKTVGAAVLSTTLDLKEGSQLGLYVNARDAVGNVSQASSTLPVSVPPCAVDNQAPTVPTGLMGKATGTTLTLNWTASTDNLAVTAYDIYRNDNKVGSTASLLFTDSGLAANTTYRYAVAARDAQNNVSALSISTSVTTGSSCTGAVCSTVEVARDKDIPWGIVSLSDGSVLYSRRDARDIVRLNPTNGSKTTVGMVPNVDLTDGEGGLLGLAVSPNFPDTDQWIYIYHTTSSDNRIVRIRYVNGSLDTGSLQVLIKGIGRNKFHNGGRLRYGPDGKLYATTGDAQNGQFAQDLGNLAGKVLRLNPDGSIPSDNPFANSYVWSYGHRNPQGLAFDSKGRLWEQEFGNSAQDETNLIKKGGNYGWPNCEGTVSQSGQGCATPGFVAPKYTYATAEASCSGIAIVRDVLYVACLRGMRVYRHVISGDSLISTQQLFSDTYGRLRTVEPTIDGGLWMSTSNVGDKDSIADNSDERIFKINLGN